MYLHISSIYNTPQSNEYWSIRQADPPNWLTSANCCTLREMTSILSRKWSNVPRGGERIRHGTWKLLVRWLWGVVWLAPKANKTPRLCSVANSTAGVGQDLVHRYFHNLSTHVLHINTPTGWSTGGMQWHIVFITSYVISLTAQTFSLSPWAVLLPPASPWRRIIALTSLINIMNRELRFVDVSIPITSHILRSAAKLSISGRRDPQYRLHWTWRRHEFRDRFWWAVYAMRP